MCVQRCLHNIYKYCLHILLSLSFQSCRSTISSPSIFMGIHSKLNHISDLPSTFLIHASNMQLVRN